MSVKAYPCIGGPLSGQYATTSDFQKAMRIWRTPRQNIYTQQDPLAIIINETEYTSAGRFNPYQHEYRRYNSGARGFNPSMVWIHVSLLKPTIPASKR